MKVIQALVVAIWTSALTSLWWARGTGLFGPAKEGFPETWGWMVPLAAMTIVTGIAIFIFVGEFINDHWDD